MPIQLDALPKERPSGSFSLVPEGNHLAKIESTSVKTSAAGNEYLEIVLNFEGQGKIWDRIMASDSPYVQYKLQRFLSACNVPMVGQLTFQDLGTLVQGKQLYVDIVHKEDEYKGETRTKAEVDIFTEDIYYPVGGEAPTGNTSSPSQGSY